jgi:hypothetical protein
MDLLTEWFEGRLEVLEQSKKRDAVRSDGFGRAARCPVNDVPCVLDGLFKNKNRQEGDNVTCKDVDRYFVAVNERENIINELDVDIDLVGKNADAIFKGGQTYKTLEGCATACDTGNFQTCRVVTPPKTDRVSPVTGSAKGRVGRFESEQAGTLSQDLAADVKEENAADSRFVTSSGAYDFEKYRIKRTKQPLALSTALFYGVLGVGAAYLIKRRG